MPSPPAQPVLGRALHFLKFVHKAKAGDPLRNGAPTTSATEGGLVFSGLH